MREGGKGGGTCEGEGDDGFETGCHGGCWVARFGRCAGEVGGLLRGEGGGG